MNRHDFWRTIVIAAVAIVALTHRVYVQALSNNQIRSLTYVGKFTLPSGFSYGGRGLAYNAAHNSLFASGFVRSPTTGEVSIPAIGGTATLLQPLTDPT